jgi:phytoene dehydrogenase-like protein
METNSPKKTVLIIGAGVSGMSTGIYLQMNGFNTEIIERHVLPGGCSTAWSRQGYIFDYCIDWLIGSGEGNSVNRVWQELGALDGKNVKDFDIFNRVINEAGQEVNFYNCPDKLEAELLKISPEDKGPIAAFCRDLRRFINIDLYPSLKPKKLMTIKERLQELYTIIPNLPLIMRSAGTSMKKFSNRIKNNFLKKAINYIFFQDPETFPLLPFLYNMACAHKKNAGFPEGGSLGLSRSIEQRYLALGGKINYGNAVQKIIVENNRAIGLELKKGSALYADYIISAADGYSTIYNFLEGKYTDKIVNKLYQDILNRPGILFPSVISIFVGYKGEVGQSEPHCSSHLLNKEKAKELPGSQQNCLVLQHRSRYANGFAKEGSSVIHCTYFSDFDYWQDLRNQDKALYRASKKQVADFVCQFLEERYPGISQNIEVLEVATPATTKRYTGNYKGSIFGWKAFSPAEDVADILVNKYRMQLPGLKNFYMTGQWVLGGGLPRAGLSGRYVAQFLCDELKIPFTAQSSGHKQKFNMHEALDLPQLDDEPIMLTPSI